MLRFGLAGLGVHGQRYAKHLLAGDVPGASLSAVARRDAAAGRAFADEHGLAYVATAEELAGRDDVDAVVLALPGHLHPPAAEACLKAGKPVLVEKPLGPDAASARRVADLQQATGTPLMVGQTLRFDTVVRRLREEARRIGKLRMVSLNQRFEPTDRAWIDDPAGGGLFLNTGVHGFDLLRYLTGAEPVSVFAVAGRARTHVTEDQFIATVRMEPGGILAVVDNARFSASRSGRIELVGDEAQFWGDHIHRTLTRVVGRKRTELGPLPPFSTLPHVLQAFVDCAAGRTPSPVSARDGAAAVALVEAAQRSAREGRPVLLEEIHGA